LAEQDEEAQIAGLEFNKGKKCAEEKLWLVSFAALG
jgi:hypothetical protein